MIELIGTERSDTADSRIADTIPGQSPKVWALHPRERPHAFLRRISRPWHDGVEAAFERFDVRTLDGLSNFLLRQAEALLPLERAVEAAGADALLADWDSRCRSQALIEDLSQLGLEPLQGAEAPIPPTRDHMLGALYVLEGSKLGGRLLHRRLLTSPDPRVRAARRFLGHRDEGGWPGFLAVLDAAIPDPAALGEGARIAFSLFRTAAERVSKQPVANDATRSSLYRQAEA